MVRHVAEDSRLEVPASVPRVDDPVGQRILVDRVDGEVAARGGVADREGGIVRHLEAPVPESELGLSPRQGDVDVEPAQLDDAEGESDEVELEARGQNGRQPLGSEAEALDVEVLEIG